MGQGEDRGGVEFVTPEGAPESDPERPQPSRRPQLPPIAGPGQVWKDRLSGPNALRWRLAGGALVLVLLGLILRAFADHSTPKAGSSSSASAPASVSVAPKSAAPPSVSAAQGCPAGATCDRVTTLPTSTTAAVATGLPDATIVSSTSVLANRAGRFGPDLVSRRFVIRTDHGTITVVVAKPGAAVVGVPDVPANHVVRREQPGFRVVMACSFAPTVLGQDLPSLGRDPSLVQPQ